MVGKMLHFRCCEVEHFLAVSFELLMTACSKFWLRGTASSVLSAQELEDFAGAFDQLLLEWAGIQKFEAVVEAHAIANYTA